MNRIVIGVTGPIGSGVTTTARAISNNGFKLLRISELIKEELKHRTSSSSETSKGTFAFDMDTGQRKKMQDLGNECRRDDPAYWIKKTLQKAGIIDGDGHVCDRESNLVIESIRNPYEADHLRNLFAPNFFLVAIQASRTTRWERVKSDYSSHEGLFAQDDRRDTDEDLAYGQQVDRCVNQADYVYVNEKPKGASAKQLEGVWNELETDIKLMRSVNLVDWTSKAGLRGAKPEEVAMAVAYAQSHQSACLKRHVGAVIVDPNGLPLSVGFNENPIGVAPCKIGFQYCFKDEEMHRMLEERRNVKCPTCGTEHSKLESPWNCADCQENLKLYFFPSRNMELCTAIHAEERAIRSLGDRSARDATIYTTTFPCFQCSRYIIDAGIKKVVYVEAYPVAQAVNFLRQNDVTLVPFNGFKARAFNIVFKQVN